MCPTLFRIGPWEAQPYGLLLTLSFLVGIWLARRRARAAEIDPQHVMTIAFFILVGTLVGARLAYVAVNYDQFAGHWLAIVNPFQKGTWRLGGLVMNGGVLGAIAGVLA